MHESVIDQAWEKQVQLDQERRLREQTSSELRAKNELKKDQLLVKASGILSSLKVEGGFDGAYFERKSGLIPLGELRQPKDGITHGFAKIAVYSDTERVVRADVNTSVFKRRHKHVDHTPTSVHRFGVSLHAGHEDAGYERRIFEAHWSTSQTLQVAEQQLEMLEELLEYIAPYAELSGRTLAE